MRKTVVLFAILLSVVSRAWPYSLHEAWGHSTSYPAQYGQWQEALLAGNGKMGIMVFGNPLHETIVVNDRFFNFPGAHPRTFADVPRDTLQRIKQLCVSGRFKEANDLAVRTANWKDGGEGGRHPGYLLKVDMDSCGAVRDYDRSTDYSTGEVFVRWTDGRGKWVRRSFVSRAANAAVLNLSVPSSGKLNCAISLQMPAEAGFPKDMKIVKRGSDSYLNVRANYAAPMNDTGYEGGARIILKGGSSRLCNDTLFVEDASDVLILVKNTKYGSGCAGSWPDGGVETALDELPADYDDLLDAHKALHSDIYGRVTLDLGATRAERALSNEELLSMQKQTDRPILALWKRLFNAGRYHFLSSGCEITPPDLLGIWTGDCNAGWGGYYHLDANLNLQVCGGNIGAMPEVMEGYFHLNEVWRKDFETNAAKLLGCRGMLACGNSPGLSSGLLSSINTYYPYHYATGEEVWMLYPFWEHYLVTEDTVFLRNRLFPMLKSMGEFYEDFLEYKDADGHYIFAGSVSPENQPSNLRVSLLNNSAFDVSGARFLLSTLVKVCDMLGEEQGAGGGRDRWNEMLEALPPYQVNADGAIKEWGWPGLEDNYGHRHSSHLMMVWPYRELSEDKTPELYQAARRALEMRDRHDYENAGHGLLHAALIAAGVHNPVSLMDKLMTLVKKDFYYSSLATSHYPNHGTFCTDVCHSVPGILIEMLVGSTEEGIDLLPALPEGFEHGCIRGVRTRCGVTVRELEWDVKKGKVTVKLYSDRSKTIRLRMGGCSRVVSLKGGKEQSMSIDIPAV